MESACVSDPRYVDQRNIAQPQKPVPDQGGVLGSSPFNMCNMFFEGYNDCAKEALRFLIEDEGLPLNHPMVAGLFEYLREQQRLVYIQYCLGSGALPCNTQAGTDGSMQISKDNCESHDESRNNSQNNICETSKNASETTNKANDTNEKTTILNTQSDTTITAGVENSFPPIESDVKSDTIQYNPSNETEKLAIEIAEELYCLLQNDDDFLSETEDLDDEGFEDYSDL